VGRLEKFCSEQWILNNVEGKKETRHKRGMARIKEERQEE
jgi:hypothetical protein